MIEALLLGGRQCELRITLPDAPRFYYIPRPPASVLMVSSKPLRPGELLGIVVDVYERTYHHENLATYVFKHTRRT